MSSPLSLATRVMEPEEIDDPDLDPQLMRGALQGLTTINFLSASAASVWGPIKRLARELKTDRLRVLDIATGAGDVPIALWRKARNAGLSLDIRGVDISDMALGFAREKAKTSDANISFDRFDVFKDELPTDYDVITTSLFLHHLDNAMAERLLAKMAAATKHLVLVNDLRRHWWGLTLSYFAGHVLTRSPVVRVDAVRSVRAAFTMNEALAMAQHAGLQDAKISRRWPCRFLLSWRKRSA